ncbi:MAG: hypothetical protein ACQSGP_08205 [Frankia sp.]
MAPVGMAPVGMAPVGLFLRGACRPAGWLRPQPVFRGAVPVGRGCALGMPYRYVVGATSVPRNVPATVVTALPPDIPTTRHPDPQWVIHSREIVVVVGESPI